jgi:uncharacterized protein
MIVWIDADACPAQIKEILFRAAERVGVRTVLIANHALRVPRSAFIEARQVESGFDVADARILAGLSAGDLVVTADVPLAAQVVAAKAFVLEQLTGALFLAILIARLAGVYPPRRGAVAP